MIAGLHAVAGEAQHVAHAHRRAAEYVSLDGNAVAVTAGNLHHRRVTDARQQRADGQAGHVAIRTAPVRGIDGIDVALEHAGAPVDILRVGRVRRSQFRGDRKGPGAQHALETTG
jgi:hypothetical protein